MERIKNERKRDTNAAAENRKRKMTDRNFEAFKKYNKILLATSPPLPTDPFLELKREQYRQLEAGNEDRKVKTVFDRLTQAQRTNRTDESNSPQSGGGR